MSGRAGGRGTRRPSKRQRDKGQRPERVVQPADPWRSAGYLPLPLATSCHVVRRALTNVRNITLAEIGVEGSPLMVRLSLCAALAALSFAALPARAEPLAAKYL